MSSKTALNAENQKLARQLADSQAGYRGLQKAYDALFTAHRKLLAVNRLMEDILQTGDRRWYRRLWRAIGRLRWSSPSPFPLAVSRVVAAKSPRRGEIKAPGQTNDPPAPANS